MSGWTYIPPWGIRLVAAAGAGLVFLWLIRALRERKQVRLVRQIVPLAVRIAVVAALVWVALNPTLVEPRRVEGKPTLALLIDTSRSMATPDVDGESRLAAALEEASDPATLAALEEAFELEVVRFDRTSAPTDLASLGPEAADGKATDIGAAVAEQVARLADANQAGIAIVSDGRSTAAGAIEAARLALARGVPLWTACVGGEVTRRDLWMEVPASEVLAYAGAEVELTGELHETGYSHRSFDVELLAGGKVLDRFEVTPDDDGRATVKARVTAPEAGEHRYVFRAVPDAAEADTSNNERSVFLRVVGDKVRVLVVEGQPHWDTKFCVQSLIRNPRVDVTAAYRLGEDRSFGVVSAGGVERRREGDLFPRTAEGFSRYDVIVMGRGCEAFFDDETEDLLTDFVARQGGALVFARGKPYAGRFRPLAKFEPVVWGEGALEGAHIEPTAIGAESPVFEIAPGADLTKLLERLPALDRVAHTVGVKPLAVVLARGESERAAVAESPVVMTYQLYGQGRVVTLNAAGLWRWAFKEKSEGPDEHVYDRFWGSVLRWLLSGSDFMASHDVALRSDRRVYTDEQPMRFMVRTRGLDGAAYRPKLFIARASDPDGSAAEVEPRREPGGTYVAETRPFAPGTYEVTLASNIGRPEKTTLIVEVVSSSVENRVLSADPALMETLARTSEGRAIRLEDLPRMGGIVEAWRARRALAENRTPVWDHWWILALVVCALGVEWFARRREGLL